jgi:hypothetical protein
MPHQTGQETVGVHELDTRCVGKCRCWIGNILTTPKLRRLRSSATNRRSNVAEFRLLTGVHRYQAGRITVRIALQSL